MTDKGSPKPEVEPEEIIAVDCSNNTNIMDGETGQSQSQTEQSLYSASSSTSLSPNPFTAVINRNTSTVDNNNQLVVESDENKGEEIPSSSTESQRPDPPGPSSINIPADDFLNTLIGFNNMFLAHEISINPEYTLERFSAPPDSIEFQVSQQIRRAFWDVLEEQLNLDPPNYMQALSIFDEIKTMLLSLLMPHHHTLRSRINEVLDTDLIRQQVQQDALDFPRYAAFVFEILAQLCAPSRDEEVQKLHQLSKPVEVFQNILEVMEHMKLDMANFYIQQFRPTVVKNCVQYERKKFADFLQLEYRMDEDGLRNTRRWLLRHKVDGQNANTTIYKAFTEILRGTLGSTEWPETLALDAARLHKIAITIKRLGIQGAVVLTSESLSQTIMTKPALELRNVLKPQLDSLISEADVANDKILKESLDRVAEQVLKLIDDIMIAQEARSLDELQKDSIRQAIVALVNEDNKIRNLLEKRIVEFAESWMMSGPTTQIPGGLNCIGAEVLTTVKSFYRIFQYNRAVFDCIYTVIVEEETVPQNLNQGQNVKQSQKNILDALSSQ